MKRSRLSAADLIDCYKRLGPVGLAHAARLMGLVQDPCAKQESREELQPPSPPSPRQKPVEPKPAEPITSMKGIPWHTVHMEPVEAKAGLQIPDWFQNAVVTKPRETCGDPLARMPLKKPLVPWPRCWPVLKQVLGCWQQQGALDLVRVVTKLAKGEAIVELPRKRRTAWAAHAWILVDLSSSMEAFREDIHQLLNDLQDLRGSEGLRLLYCLDGPGQEWLHWHSHKPVTLGKIPWGTPVLAISDLGLPDAGGDWFRLGTQLKRQGANPVALAPLSPASYRKSDWSLLFWDRDSPMKPERPAPSPSGPAAETLMSLLAPAVRVEPTLLRAARNLLPVDMSSVEDERAVWEHLDTRSCPLGFDFEPQRVDHWRSRFLQLPEAQRTQALALIRQHHTHLPKTIIEEEFLVSQSLAGHMPKSDLLGALLKNTTDGHTPTLDWVKRFVSRQQHGIWDHPQMAAAMVLAQRAVHGDNAENWRLPPGFDLNRAGWLLSPSATPSTWTLVQYHKGAFRFLPGRRTETKQEKPLVICTSRTGVFQLTTHDDTRQIVLSRGREFAVTGAEQFQIHSDQAVITIAQAMRPSWSKFFNVTSRGILAKAGDGRQLIWVPPGDIPVYGDSEVASSYHRSWGCWMDHSAYDQLKDGFKKPNWAVVLGRDEYGIYADWHIKDQMQRMRWIWPGSFLMGSPEEELGRHKDETLHRVVLSRGFWIADTTCSQALWTAVMDTNPSVFQGSQLPISSISGQDIHDLCKSLQAELGIKGFRLPTEAEWEYACRAGTQTPYSFGMKITSVDAKYNTDRSTKMPAAIPSAKEPISVDQMEPNPWGLFQMHGNVLEWTKDYYGPYPKGPVVDPKGPAQGGNIVLRGGSFKVTGRYLRSASRAFSTGTTGKTNAGFRLVLDWE